MSVLACIEQTDVFECLLLEGNQHTSNNLLEAHGGVFQTVGHYIIDILDENHISIDIVEVLNQSTMTTRTEQNSTVVVAERFVIDGSCYGICA